MDDSERARITSILTGAPTPVTSHDSKILSFTKNPLDAVDYHHHRNEARHSRHWQALASLAPCVTTPVQPALEACRHIVFMFLHRGQIGTVRTRQEVSLWGWTEQQFEAVFGSLRESGGYLPLPSPSTPATSFQAAWGGTGVYQSQISCQVGSDLQEWCSFEQWPQRQGRMHCGCATLGCTTLRFLLELTVSFTCNPARVVGRKTEVTLFMTKATFNSKHVLKFHPVTNTHQLPLRIGAHANQKALSYMTALVEYRSALESKLNS